jgi:hypothetical protein
MQVLMQGQMMIGAIDRENLTTKLVELWRRVTDSECFPSRGISLDRYFEDYIVPLAHCSRSILL